MLKTQTKIQGGHKLLIPVLPYRSGHDNTIKSVPFLRSREDAKLFRTANASVYPEQTMQEVLKLDLTQDSFEKDRLKLTETI